MQMPVGPIIGLRFRKSTGEHWITIHPHGTGANAAGETVKGRHVLIDGEGRIVGGAVPKTAQGKHITSWWKDQSQPEPKLHEHLRGHGIAFAHHEAGHLTTGHGYQEGRNKWGRPEASPGHVRVGVSSRTDRYLPLDSAFVDKDRVKGLGAKFGPQLGPDYPKNWYLPIDQLPHLLRELPHAEVSAKALARYEQYHAESSPTPATQKMEQRAATQAAQAEVTAPFQLPAGMKREAMAHGDLHNYQKGGVQFLLDQKRAILGHGVGLGKTLESIAAARAAQEKGAGTFLILCPSSRKYGWQDEIQKFSDASSVVLDASLTPKQQQARWAQIEADKPHFIITNYEALQKPELAEKLHALAPNVIADEAHRVKNSKAKTTKGFQQWKDASYAWLLTATPFPNGQPAETYTMLSHTQSGVVGSWKQFARDHVVFQKVNTPFGPVQKPVALKNVPQLREKLQKVVQIKQMTDPDVGLQLPDRRRVDVRLDMTKDQHKMYAAMANQIAGEIAGMSDADFQRASAQVLVKLKRLEQIALDPDLVREPDQRTG
ncbi:MAG: SNF2-related protein, partial [Thermaerobacter sp.]|nr:SNF2-related protein [Thermaerobacter sp.]